MRDSDFPVPVQVLPANFSMITMAPIEVTEAGFKGDEAA